MSTLVDQAVLTRVFGTLSSGNTPEERALTSDREFVRGQTMLAKATPLAKGRRLSALEALRIFGFDVLRRGIEDGQAPIVPSRNEPAQTLSARRTMLGLPIDGFAKALKLSPDEIIRAETPGKVTSIRVLENIARHLAIDERFLGFDKKTNADSELGVRFRTLFTGESGIPPVSANVVAKLAEAAWVIARQATLLVDANETGPKLDAFKPTSNYRFPAYEIGYQLADKAREQLGLLNGEPISSMRKLIERDLRIPLVETELGQTVAGATIENGSHRGIVVNTQGRNANPWLRRMTLAHELGHLLWDPPENLKNLKVDRYDDIAVQLRRVQDPVEMRANAFAIAFLAPPIEVDRIVREHQGGWSAIVRISELFGISETACRYHVQNICRVQIQKGSEKAEISDEWLANEDYTNDFFPIASTPLSRRGRFAWAVIKEYEKSAISVDTAATLLGTDPSTFTSNITKVTQLTSD